MKSKIFFIVFYSLLISCAARNKGPYGPNYYYGSYMVALDNYKKDLTPESKQKLLEQLYHIISKSKEFDVDLNTELKEWRVPPGICAELGFMLAKDQEYEKANKLYELELKFYPESKVLIEKLKSQLGSVS